MSDEKKNISNINIGEMLIAARDGKGLSVATAALHCNLEASIIEKLEANKFSEVGAPVFTRGYLNLYARCLGLNENEVSEAFNQLKTNPSPSLQISEANAASQSQSFKRRGISKWFYFVPLLLILGWALQQLLSSDSWLISQLNKALVSAPKEETNDKGIVLTVGNDQKSNKTEVTLIPENIDSTMSTEETAENAILNNNADNEGDVTITTESSTGNENASDNNEITLTSSDSNIETNNTVEKPAEVIEPTVKNNSDEAIKLTFAGGESWIQINNADKKIVKIGGIKKGETIVLPASGAPYSFNIGRPENVEMTIYGKEEKLSKYQRPGTTRRFNVSLPNG